MSRLVVCHVVHAPKRRREEGYAKYLRGNVGDFRLHYDAFKNGYI